MQKYKPKQSTSVKQDTEEVVYFRLRRDEKEEPEQEFIVNTNPRKRHGTQKEEEIKRQQKGFNETADITKLFSHLGLNPVQYFLKKVDDFSTNRAQSHLLRKANQFSNQSRALKREQLIAKSRGIQEQVNIKIKIVDIEQQSQQYVELGGKKIPVENLGHLKDHFYVLSKRKEVKEGPTLKLPESSYELLSKIDFEETESEQQNQSEEDDSNRESNPDYDYPEQDYNEDSDEGVVHKDYYNGQSDQENGSDVELDEEQVYRKYLKRCSKKAEENSDDDYY